MTSTSPKQLVKTECLFPGCHQPSKPKKPGSRGPAPKYCNDPTHNRTAAHRKRKELEEHGHLDHLTLGEIRQVLAELTSLATPKRHPEPTSAELTEDIHGPAAIVNMTPQLVRILDEDGSLVRDLPPSGKAARLKVTRTGNGSLDGLPVTRTTYGEVEGLPDAEEGVYFLVSLPTALGLMGSRDDLLVVDREVREGGVIVGCRGLARPFVG
ncbi:hypothetical protein ABT282_08065 [Streptomyces sp. NPDC000927]|uniref:hypothetical protein n=1 Tax=Streptomyces sp. NPDC000927 TaxID=3154371 RepID=UPI0033250448